MKKFNLSLDDFSPHPRAGLNFESIEWCNKIIKEFPNFKVNLFMPAAYCRLGEEPQNLSKHAAWVKRASQLPTKNYRFNFHGFNHRRVSQKYGNSNNDEWQHLTKKEADYLFDMITRECDWTKLPFHDTFRPPGWKISRPAAQMLTDNGFLIAGNKQYYHKLKDIPGLRWISYNWDMVKPCSLKGDVLAFGHTSNWTNNYMDETRYNLIIDVIKKYKYEFLFLEDF